MNPFLKVAQDAALRAGAILREHFGGTRNISYKGDINLVTEMDTRSERAIVAIEHLEPVLTGNEVCALQALVDQVEIDESLQEYILTIVSHTRTSKWLELGVSPRGTLALQRAAQVSALMAGRQYCTPDDIQPLVIPVFAHRVMLQTDLYAESSAEDAEKVLHQILEEIPVPL